MVKNESVVEFLTNEMTGPAARVLRSAVASWNWLRMAWATQPVLVVSAAMGIAGKCRLGVLGIQLTFDLTVYCTYHRSSVGSGETRDKDILERDGDMANPLQK